MMKLIHDIVYRCMQTGALIIMVSFSPTPFAAQGVIVKDAWARATAPGQTSAGLYMEIVSTTDAVLVGAASPRAKSAEVHATHAEGGVMKMRAVPRLTLPAQKTIKLAPGGLHVMLLDIKQPLREKETVPLELTIEGASGTKSTVKVEVEVRPLTAAAAPHLH